MPTDTMSARNPSPQHDAAALGILSDEALMERTGLGEERAYQVLVERHVGRSLGFATRVLGNAADGEEVMQEAFVRLWRSAPNWEQGGAKFSTWFYRVVMNLCIDRQRTRKGNLVPLDDAGDPADDRPGADNTLHDQQVSTQLQDALATLPDRQGAAITLCYLQGLSNREAAEILEINIKALESLLSRGRQALKAQLENVKDDLMGFAT